MKKISLLLVLSLSLFALSCKKKGCIDETAINYNADAKKDDGSCEYDTSKPTITIIGDNPATVEIGATYEDEGATAVNFDGSSVTVTADESDVNTSAAGSYEVVYTASNTNGTSTATRIVNVVLSADVYIGDYSNENDCGLTGFPLAGNSAVIAGPAENEVIIDNAFNLVGGQIIMTVDNQNISVPFQTQNITVGDLEFSGSGVMNSDGTVMTITFDYNNTTPVVGGSGTCTATFTKQ
jgi:hypothetical protein